MKVTLNKQSWHYRLFKKELPYTNTPASLCPYFWTIVGLCLVTPFLLVGRGLERLSKWVSNLIPKSKEVVKPEQSHDEWLKEWNDKIKKDRIKMQRIDKIGKVVVTVLLISLLITVVFVLGHSLYMLATNSTLIQFFVGLGIAIGFAGFLYVVVEGFTKYGHYLGDWIISFFKWINPFKWSITKMIGWMVVAGYKKMCPLVEWSGEEIKKEQYYGN